MIDFREILTNCSGRLTLKDAKLLYNTARFVQPKNMLEIGCMDGCSTMVLGEVAREFNAHLYCIEPSVTGKWLLNVKNRNIARFITLIWGACPWVSYDLVKKPIDYLFIDGNHRSRWAIVDYHYWEPFVRQGGLIAFHDWSGIKQVGMWIRRAVEIIMEDDPLEQVEIVTGGGRGLAVFRKTWDRSPIIGGPSKRFVDGALTTTEVLDEDMILEKAAIAEKKIAERLRRDKLRREALDQATK